MGYRLNRLDEPVFMAVPKPMLTEFGIHHRLESCEADTDREDWALESCMWPLINRNDFQEGNFDKNGAFTFERRRVVLQGNQIQIHLIYCKPMSVCVQIICVHLMNCILITTSKTALGNKKYKGQTIFGTLFVWWPLTMQEHKDSNKGIANWLKMSEFLLSHKIS